MMKYIFYFLIFSLSLSCSIDHSIPDDYEHQGIWILQRTLTNVADAEKDENPDILESYVFMENAKFTKQRWQDNAQLKAEGTYKILENSSQGPGEPLLKLELTFEDEESPLIANCTNKPVEHLIITREYILTNTWIMCDGLGMEYEKEDQADLE